MNTNRAQQILESPEKLEVLHDGKPVWIESVNEHKHMVSVKDMKNHRFMEVPADALIETGHKLTM